ncbi:MAG: hypothetical protein V1743_06590, partial [Nanoarchaeota archaeon]
WYYLPDSTLWIDANSLNAHDNKGPHLDENRMRLFLEKKGPTGGMVIYSMRSRNAEESQEVFDTLKRVFTAQDVSMDDYKKIFSLTEYANSSLPTVFELYRMIGFSADNPLLRPNALQYKICSMLGTMDYRLTSKGFGKAARLNNEERMKFAEELYQMTQEKYDDVAHELIYLAYSDSVDLHTDVRTRVKVIQRLSNDLLQLKFIPYERNW